MRKVDLPPIPSSWEALTGEQVIQVNRLRRQSSSATEYKFLLFCYFVHLSLDSAYVYTSDGKELFYFYQLDGEGKPVGEAFPMLAWQIHEAYEEYLKWIEQPCNRLSEVVDKLTVCGTEYAGTGYAMARMTYQQHQLALRYYSEIQRIEKALSDMLLNGPSPFDEPRINQLSESLADMRCMFMAAVFTPKCKIGSKTVDGKVVVYDVPQTDYVFSPEQIQREHNAFRHVSDATVDAVLMHFNGVLMHYHQMYPKLFTEGTSRKVDMIKVEESTLNALQSELKFANYQTIYDSNAPFILGKLHAIILKANEIEKMNEKMKH